MAQTTTIARPYARAVFELARDGRAYDAWQAQLELLAAVARDPQVRRLLSDPKQSPPALAALFVGVGGDALDGAGRNLVQLLAQRKRLAVLPEILTAFIALRREAERIVDVELVSAVPVDAVLQQRFITALEARLGQRVQLKNLTDPTLIGGALVRAGDLVIDASVRGRLERLAIDLVK